MKSAELSVDSDWIEVWFNLIMFYSEHVLALLFAILPPLMRFAVDKNFCFPALTEDDSSMGRNVFNMELS